MAIWLSLSLFSRISFLTKYRLTQFLSAVSDMEETLDGRLLKLNQSLRTRSKKSKGRPQGDVYDWVERVTADDPNDDQQHVHIQMAVKEAMSVVKENLKDLKAITVSQTREDILRILVLHSCNLASGTFPIRATEYLFRTFLLTSRRSLKPLVYMALAALGNSLPVDIENQFYDTIFQDMDACNFHTLRWIANTTLSIPCLVVERMVSSLQNLLFRSVASVPLKEKAASALLHLTRTYGGVRSLSSEMNRC